MPRSISTLGLERPRWALFAVAAALLLSGVFVIRANAATLDVTTTALHEGAVGQTYDPVTLAATGGTGAYTWSVVGGASALPAGLSLSTGGVLSGTPTALGITNFTVRVRDANGNTATEALSIKVNPPVVVQTTALGSAVAGSSYPATQLVATGGTGAPYTWTTVGALPAPLALTTGGSLSSTALSAGTLNFTVKATDAAGHSDEQALSIVVTAAGALTITTASLPNGVQGQVYSAPALTATGGVLPYTWTLDGGTTLPAGLSLSTAGAITGTPSGTGTTNFTMRITDSTGGTALTTTKAFTINVMAPVDITTASPLTAGAVGAFYSRTLAATGGTPPYTWALASGSTLPAGLTLSASTGALSGTPTTAGTTSFSVQVTDFAGYSTTEPFSLTINAAPAPVITTTSLPNAVAGTTDYTQQLFKTGGTTSDTWSFTTAVPTGLAISSTGLLTWPTVPATLGSHTFTVQVTGSAGTDTQQLTLTVSNVASQPNQPNIHDDDDDNEFRGKCHAFFQGSEMGRKNKAKSASFQRLVAAAGAQQELQNLTTAREALEAKVRNFCGQQSGFWHWHDDDDDDDDDDEQNISSSGQNSNSGSSNQAEIKGKSSGKGRRD